MQTEDPQQTSSDHYDRKKSQRVAEASVLWEQMQSAGEVDGTVLALDFVQFETSKENLEALASDLSESYSGGLRRLRSVFARCRAEADGKGSVDTILILSQHSTLMFGWVHGNIRCIIIQFCWAS